jgi:hypothetical protein
MAQVLGAAGAHVEAGLAARPGALWAVAVLQGAGRALGAEAVGAEGDLVKASRADGALTAAALTQGVAVLGAGGGAAH